MANLINIIAFIREEISEYRMEINRSTLIENDLGITGDDAIDLIQNFSKRFNVDISKFQYDKYFYPEPSMYFSNRKEITPLSIADLEKAVITGKIE